MIINSNTNNQSLLTVGRAQSFTNAPSQPTSDRRQRLPVQEDDLYDDTVIEQQQESGKDMRLGDWNVSYESL
jgi:hypothetical protein